MRYPLDSKQRGNWKRWKWVRGKIWEKCDKINNMSAREKNSAGARGLILISYRHGIRCLSQNFSWNNSWPNCVWM